jgi:alpha-1,2-mannosyltransferase
VTRRPIWELVLAAIGASFLLVVAINRWGIGGDEHAYWLAARRLIEGQPLYDPTVTIVTPYAYLYAPPLAQAMVPFALVLPAWAFDALWTAGMLVALWWLAGRDLIRSLALVAFPPVAVEFWFRNVHLFLAVLVVLGLRRWPGWYAVGAAIKVSPGLGIVFDALRGRWRAAAQAVAVGSGLLILSVALAPDAWTAYLDFVRGIDLGQQSSFVPIPFLVRAAVAVVLVVIASRLALRWGELLLVVAVTLALPSLWFTGLSLLVAAVPLWRRPPEAIT